jgi:hypothetical protein
VNSVNKKGAHFTVRFFNCTECHSLLLRTYDHHVFRIQVLLFHSFMGLYSSILTALHSSSVTAFHTTDSFCIFSVYFLTSNPIREYTQKLGLTATLKNWEARRIILKWNLGRQVGEIEHELNWPRTTSNWGLRYYIPNSGVVYPNSSLLLLLLLLCYLFTPESQNRMKAAYKQCSANSVVLSSYKYSCHMRAVRF